MNTLFATIIRNVGGQVKMAEALSRELGKKVHQSRVSYWKNMSPEDFPGKYCLPIERITNGAIRASDLRPDLYPPSLMSRPASEPVPHAANVARKSRKGLRGGMQGVAQKSNTNQGAAR